jgi:hypothetical protein
MLGGKKQRQGDTVGTNNGTHPTTIYNFDLFVGWNGVFSGHWGLRGVFIRNFF